MKRLRDILCEARELLLEYDQETTWKQHGKKVLDRAINSADVSHPLLTGIRSYFKTAQSNHKDPYSLNTKDEEGEDTANMHSHFLIGHLEKTDPTPNKKYVQHIARIYGNGGVNHFEDLHSRMKPAIRDFEDLKNRKILPPEHRDIGKIKSLSELEDIVEPHKEKTSKRAQDKAYHEKMKSQATITDHPTFTHTIPHTAEAAAHFGQGTRWCTATENPADSAFENYNGTGSLHILSPKNPKYKGEKYQAHLADPESGFLASSIHNIQLMDERDNDGLDTLHKNHPEIYDHLNNLVNEGNRVSTTVQGYSHPDAAVQMKTLHNYPAGTTSEHINHMLDSKNPHVVLSAASTGKVGRFDERIYNAAKTQLDGDPRNQGPFGHDAGIVADTMIHNKKIHSNALEAIIDHPKTDFARTEAAAHRNLNKEAIDEYMNHENPKVREGLARNPSISDEHLHTLMKDEDLDVRNEAHATWLERRSPGYRKPKALHDIIFHGNGN